MNTIRNHVLVLLYVILVHHLNSKYMMMMSMHIECIVTHIFVQPLKVIILTHLTPCNFDTAFHTTSNVVQCIMSEHIHFATTYSFKIILP